MENFDAQSRLDIISDSISAAKENIKNQSFYYILWGWLVIISSLFNFALLKFGAHKLHFIPWILIMPLGWVATIIYARNHSGERGFETHLESFLKYLWIVLGLSMLVVVFISIMNKMNPAILTLVLAGIGTTVSGFTMKFKPLIWGGNIMFIFSISCLYIQNENVYLIYAVAIALGYLLPAYRLKKVNTDV